MCQQTAEKWKKKSYDNGGGKALRNLNKIGLEQTDEL